MFLHTVNRTHDEVATFGHNTVRIFSTAENFSPHSVLLLLAWLMSLAPHSVHLSHPCTHGTLELVLVSGNQGVCIEVMDWFWSHKQGGCSVYSRTAFNLYRVPSIAVLIRKQLYSKNYGTVVWDDLLKLCDAVIDCGWAGFLGSECW